MKFATTLLLFILCLGLDLNAEVFLKAPENLRFHTGEAAEEINYIYNSGNGQVYLRNDGISFVAKKVNYSNEKVSKNELESAQAEMHRVDLNFKNNLDFNIKELEKVETKKYFANANGSIELEYYKEIIYRNVYEGIDFRAYFTEDNLFEFDFIIHPGSNPYNIKLEIAYESGKEIIESGELKLNTLIEPILLSKPVAFQSIGNIKNNISCEFSLNENLLSFSIEEYNRSEKLIIDPITRFWGSYYGDDANDTGYDITEDSKGNIYITGFTESINNIAVGGYQTIHGGLEDAYLAKFDSNGDRIWSTYYGDMNFEVGYGCAVDAEDNVILVGETSSDTNIATVNGHQTNYGGGSADGFIAKFTEMGNLLWATYYGGEEQDKANDVVADSFGNIYVTGFTGSQQNIFFQGHQFSLGGGIDAFAVKFNPVGDRVWGTYYGGMGDDFGNGIELDQSRNVYIVGTTESISSIAHNGYQNNHGGFTDAFFAKFDIDGIRVWGSYFGGTERDAGNGISIYDDSLYICGNTRSISNIAYNGHQINHGGNWDGFVAKFDINVNGFWASYLGSTENDFLDHIDVNENGVYVVGNTDSESGIAEEAWQNVYAGGVSDGMFAKFLSDGSLDWNTYYGGSNRDELRGVSAKEKLYITGFTNSEDNIYDNGFQQDHGGLLDALFAEMSESELLLFYDSEYCAGNKYMVQVDFTNFNFDQDNEFVVELSDMNGNFSNPTEIGRKESTTMTDIEITIPEEISYSTRYKLRVRSTSPAYTGTSPIKNATIIPTPEINSDNKTLCARSIREYSTQLHGNSEAIWNIEEAEVISQSGSSIRVRWLEAGEYEVQLVRTTDFGCSDTVEITQKVEPLPSSTFTGESEVCTRQNYFYTPDESGNYTYNWTISSGSITSNNEDGVITVNWEGEGSGSIELEVTDTLTGCKSTSIDSVNIFKTPQAEIVGPNKTCRGCTEKFSSNLGGKIDEWNVINGTIVEDNNIDIDVEFDTQSDTAIVELIKSSLEGDCSDTTRLKIIITDEPFTAINGNESVCEFEEYEYATSSNPDLINDWTVEGGTIVEDNENRITVRWGEAGSGKIKLVHTGDGISYKDSAEVDITINEKPSFSAEVSGTICKLDTGNVTLSPADHEYEIFGPTITVLQSNRFIPQEAGNHKIYIRATNEFDCSTLDSVEIEVEPIPDTPEIVIDEDTDKIYAVNIDNPDNYEFLWFRDGELIEITSSDTLTAQEKGIYTLKIRSKTKDCDSDFSNEIKYNITSVVSALEQVNIYPNPAESYLNVESSSLMSRIEIVDELGRVIYESENNFNKRININEYSSGVYFVKIVINDKLLTRKIIIK